MVVTGLPQVTPLTANVDGTGLLPVHEPLNPMSREAPEARVPFQDAFFAVTFRPFCDQSADHPWVTR